MQELTGAIRKGGQAQYLDKLQVERERGITVKVRHEVMGSNCNPIRMNMTLNTVSKPSILLGSQAQSGYKGVYIQSLACQCQGCCAAHAGTDRVAGVPPQGRGLPAQSY